MKRFIEEVSRAQVSLLPEILACEQAGITPFVSKPMTSSSKAEGRFGKQDFVYIAADDEYQCLRIPRHPATQSALIWPGIPRPSGHLFHGHPAGQSERSDAGGALLV